MESFKLTFYMMFPVIIFYVHNHPSIFENWMEEHRKLIYPPVDAETKAKIDMLRKYQEQAEKKKADQLFADLTKESWSLYSDTILSMIIL